MSPSILTLPNEILCEVIENLTDVYDVLALAKTCKQLHILSHPRLHRLVLEDHDGDPALLPRSPDR